MVVDEGIDYTPEFTFTTLQFHNETVNIIVTSLIAVFILANIGSIISKIVYFTRDRDRFSYDSWLRAFIFANSDNPVRIIAWIFRGYTYRDRLWKRSENKRCLARLVIPLLARLTLLVFSIASIAITLPSAKRISACGAADYMLTFDVTKAVSSELPNSICLNIPLKTRRGSVLASAAYCSCPIGGKINGLDGSGVVVYRDENEGRLRTILFSEGRAQGYASYVEWKRTDDELDGKVRSYRTDVSPRGSQLDQASHADIAIRAISESNKGCTPGEITTTSNTTTNQHGYLVKLGCDFVPENEIKVVGSHLRNALSWTKTRDTLPRLVLEGTVSTTGRSSKECPIVVSIQRPLVNMAPLFCGLVGIFLLNIIVTIYVSNHGNALDAGFHIIKEALGHDCTSNPIEKSVHHEGKNELRFRKWLCSGGGTYVGFIGRRCDRAVNEFEKGATVCCCANVVREMEDSVNCSGDGLASASDTSNSFGAFHGAHGYTGAPIYTGYNNFHNQG